MTAPAYQAYDRVIAFDTQLGDPFDEANVFSLKQALLRDEAEAYPDEPNARLQAMKFAEYYIPRRYGGQFASYEELLAMVRMLARRDLTVAIAQAVNYLGALPILVGGSDQQRHSIVQHARQGRLVAFGLTEQRHGTDILANEVRVEHAGDGLWLSGSKWLIGNGSRSQVMTVFARSVAAGGQDSFSLYIVDKAALEPASLQHTAKIKTHGIRGADIAGVSFERGRLAPQALIGKVGSAPELVLKALQVSRTLCAGLSLGAADTALRTVLKFARHRELYGGTVYDLPYPRALLRDVFCDLLIADCLSIVAARALHTTPTQTSTWSAIAKYFVPTSIDQALQSLTRVLGARFYVRQGHEWGIFQKILRDAAIVSVFDGSTVVNQNLIINHLRYRQHMPAVDPATVRERWQQTVLLEAALPTFAPEKLQVSSLGADDLLDSLPLLCELIAQHAPAAIAPVLQEMVGQLRGILADHAEILAALRTRYGNDAGKQPQAFAIANEHCHVVAALTCIWFWLLNRETQADFFAGGAWVVVCVAKLLRPWRFSIDTIAMEAALDQQLNACYEQNRLFSVLDLPVAYRHDLVEAI